ncbi:MAG: hypothetical protein ACTSRP_05625 [Candidatus Helarchaeota archaeon]
MDDKKIAIIVSLVCSIELIFFINFFLYTQDRIWFTIGLTISLCIFILFFLITSISTLESSINEEKISKLSTKQAKLDKLINKIDVYVEKKKEIDKNVKNIEKIIAISNNNKGKYDFQENISKFIEDIKSNINKEILTINESVLISSLRNELIQQVESVFSSKFSDFDNEYTEKNKLIKDEMINSLSNQIKNYFSELSTKFGNDIKNILKQISEVKHQVGKFNEELESLYIKIKDRDIKKEIKREKELEIIISEDIIENKIKDELKDKITAYTSEEIKEDTKKIGKKYEDVAKKIPDKYTKIIDDKASKPSVNKEPMSKEKIYYKDSIIEPELQYQKQIPSVINLGGNEIDIIKLDDIAEQIEHNKNVFRIQRNMRGKSLKDLQNMENRITKIFRGRKIIVVWSTNKQLYYVYYQI